MEFIPAVVDICRFNLASNHTVPLQKHGVLRFIIIGDTSEERLGDEMMLFMIMVEDLAPDDQEFILSIYERYKRLMFSKAKRCIGDTDAAEDIVQEVMVKLIHKIQKLKSFNRCTLTAYIVYSIRNAATDYLRRKHVHEKRVVSLCQEEAEKYYINQDPDEWIFRSEEREHFYRVWDQLPEEDKSLLARKYVFGWSDAELAQDLGCAPSSIRMKMTRARRRAAAAFQTEVLIHEHA